MSPLNFFPLLLITTISMAFVIPSDLSAFTDSTFDADADDAGSAPNATCPENEFVPPDCNPTEQTCEVPNPGAMKGCPQTGACQCKPNFYRHNGTCVPASECPEGSNALTNPPRQVATLESCGANEQWYACGRREVTCTPIAVHFINLWCLSPGCYCAPGFVRSAELGCIQSADCPKNETTIDFD